MALLTPVKLSISEVLNLAASYDTLTLSDTFVFKRGSKQIIILKNTTGALVTLTFKGNTGNLVIPGTLNSFVLSGGVEVDVPDDGEVLMVADQVAGFIDQVDATPTITSSAIGVQIAIVEL